MVPMKRLALWLALLLAAPFSAQAQLVDSVRDYTMVIEEPSTDCERVRNVGDRCSPTLDVVYLGEGVSGRKLFTTFLAQGTTTWNNGQTNTSWMTLTNVQGNINGASNTSTLVTRDADSGVSGTQIHAAAAACANLVHGGYDDWHLPALGEAHRIFLARSHIFGSSNVIWTSTEDNSTNALTLNLGTGASGTSTKSTFRALQCVRLGESPMAASKSCSSVTEIGETCGNDNVVYLGPSVSGGGLFAPAFYYLPTMTWNNGQSNSSWVTQTNVQAGVNGAANTATLATLDADSGWSLTQTHAAAEACENMSYGGYSDWYLPAAAEIHPIFVNRGSLPAWVQGATVWTSTEVNSTSANAYAVGTGILSTTAKNLGRSVLCVRKQAVAALPADPCETTQGLGNACGNGAALLVGESMDGGRLFAAAFQLPAVSWNNGQSNSSWTTLTGITSPTTGRANTASIAAADADSGWSGTQRHAAAETCNSMTLGGYSDWYLPASFEAAELTRNLAHVPAKTGVLWTSTEDSGTNAMTINVATGALTSATKATRNLVQCVRRETTPVAADVSCDTVTEVGGICGNDRIVRVGESLSGYPLFATTARFPSAPWNNGQTNTSWVTPTNIQGAMTGASNTAALVATDADSGWSGTQIHAAASVCRNLVYGGYDDWHLPASHEAIEMFRNRSLLPAAIQSGTVWTSTEVNATNATAFNVQTGAVTSVAKATVYPVQCVRTGSVPTVPTVSCDTVTSPGQTCGTGNLVYAGPSVSGGGLFTTSFLLPTATWNNGQSNSSWVTQTNVQSGINGAANTATLATLDADSGWSGAQTHSAAEACQNMTYGGYDDWYLPAAAEAHILFQNRAVLPSGIQSGTIWTSTEVNSTSANLFTIGTGALSTSSKDLSRSLLCVRKQTLPVLTPTPCEGVNGMGSVCGNGNVVLVGESINGGRLFAAAFQLPAAFWNNGQTNSSWTTLTGLTSSTNGQSNTSSLATADADSGWSGTQRHAAAETCNSMTLGGYSDWYLPASFEAAELTRNLAHVPVKTGVLWTSTEDSGTNAMTINVATGALATATKWNRNLVQCVRRETTPVVADVSCDTVTEVGGICGNDRVVRVGESLSGYPLFATSALLPATTWNNGQTNSSWTTLTNIQSGINGAANTASLAAIDADSGFSGIQFHLAAKTCSDMVYGGYDDWYLPASHEAVEVFRNASLLPTSIRSGTVWTSTEVNSTNATAFNLGTGSLSSVAKATAYPTICVRRGPSLTVASKPCSTVTEVGETCGTGRVVYAGKSPSGGDLFTTSFLLPVTTWNNGQTNSSWMIQTSDQSGINGAANSTSLSTRDADSGWTGTQTHSAAEVCQNMTYGGYSDWYLPGVSEARPLFLNRSALPVQAGTIWTSSEVDLTTARDLNIGTGAVSSLSKATNRSLLCVRKEAVPGLVTPNDCGSVSANGAVCAGGSVLYVGDTVIGERVFTTAFQFPSVFWNGGNTGTTTMINTNRRSTSDGAGNTAALAVADADSVTGTQLHKAAEACHNLNIGGFDDWYLPAIEEAEFLYANRAGLPTLGQIWSSTEAAQTTAIALTSTGTRTTISKASAVSVQCIRKQ